jgi:hypothetical protein
MSSSGVTATISATRAAPYVMPATTAPHRARSERRDDERTRANETGDVLRREADARDDVEAVTAAATRGPGPRG